MAAPKYQTPVEKYRLLRAQMDKEGYTGPVAGYRPKNLTKTWQIPSKIDPKVTYWKPDSMKDSLAPFAKYDDSKQRQSYWDDPRNIAAWHNYFSLQEDDYIVPDYVSRDYVETAYQALQSQNGNSSWQTWKPLPVGDELAYYAQMLPSPESLLENKYYVAPQDNNKYLPDSDVINPIYAVRVFEDYNKWVETIQAQQQQEAATLSDQLNQFTQTAMTVDNPLYDQYQKELEESAGADYLKLEPWEKFALIFGSAADMKNRPRWSTELGIISQASMAALGGFGMGATVGIVAGPVGAAVGGVLGAITAFAASVDASDRANRGEKVPQWLTITNRLFNLLAEGVERSVGVAHVGQSVQEEKLESGAEITDNLFPSWEQIKGGWQPFLTAWKTADLQYESLSGTQNGGIGDWLIDAVSTIAHTFFPSKNSGLTTGLGEVWQLHKGLSGPQALKGTGTIGRDSQMELYNLLSDKDNPADPEVALAIFRDKYGYGGNLNDMIYQTLLDPSVLMPRIQAELGIGYAKAQVSDLRSQMSLEGPSPALTTKLENAMRLQATFQSSLGNPLIDASPYPVQMLFELTVGKNNPDFRSTMPFFRSLTEYKVLKESGLLAPAANVFDFKQGGQNLGTVFVGEDNSVTWRKPDGTIENMYADVANSMGMTIKMIDDKPVLFINGQRSSTLHNVEGEEIYTPPEGTTVIDAEITPRTTTVSADVDMPDGSRAVSVEINAEARTYEVTGQDGITYIARADDGIVIDTLNSEGVSIHDPNRVIKINPVEIRVNGMTPADVAEAVDTVAIVGREYVTTGDIDKKLTPRPILDRKAPLPKKVKYFFESMYKPTRQTQVALVQRNFHDAIRNIAYMAQDDFSQTVRLAKAVFGGDIENLNTVAGKLANSTPIVTSAAIFKEAVSDSGLDTMVNLWNTPENKQRVAVIAKLSEAINITPEEFVQLLPAEIVSQVQKAIRNSGDLNMVQMAGTIDEASMKSLIKPYKGEGALPVTEKAAMLKWLNDLDVLVEKLAVDVYQVQKLNTVQKLLNIDKQILSFGVFAAGYLRTNVLTNLFGTATLSGVLAYRTNKTVTNFWDRVGMTRPSQGSLAYRQITHGALFDALWGSQKEKSVLKSISQKLSQASAWQPFMALSGYMEGKAHEGADMSIAEKAMSNFKLPEDSPKTKKAVVDAMGESGYNAWVAARNSAYNDAEMDAAYSKTNNDAVKLEQIQNDAITNLYGDSPDLGTELVNRLGLKKPLEEIVKTAKTPEDVKARIKAIKKEVKQQPAVRASIEAQAKALEGAEKIRQEGLVGLADVTLQSYSDRLLFWNKQHDLWDEIWKRAGEARSKGDMFLYHSIIREGKNDITAQWERVNANQLNLLKGAISAMDPGDPKQQKLFIIVNDIYKAGEEAAAWRTQHWDTYFGYGDKPYSPSVNTKDDDFVQAQLVANLKTDEFREKEFALMNSLAQEISAIFAASDGKTIAGTPIADTAAEIINLTNFYIDGYKTIANSISDYYDKAVGMDYHKRRALAVRTFKKSAIAIDKLHNELMQRAYNTWHRNHPEMQSSKQPKKKAVDNKFENFEQNATAKSETRTDKFRQQYEATKANNNIQRKAAKAEVDAQIISSGTVTRSAFRDLISNTTSEPEMTMAVVDSVAEAWAFNTGKRPEEWFSNIGKVAYVDAETFSVNVGDEVRKACGMTTFDDAGKAVLTFSKNADITTTTHELAHVIESTLTPEQRDFVSEVFGEGFRRDEYENLYQKFRRNEELTPEETARMTQVSEGFAEGYQKWLMDDAEKLNTPSKLTHIFRVVSHWLRTLISSLSERISTMDLPQSMKDLYEKVTRVVNTAEYEAAKSAKLSSAPTGVAHSLIDADNVRYPVTAKLIDLRDITNSHNTDGTMNVVFPAERQPRTYDQLYVVKNARMLEPVKMLDKNAGLGFGPMIVNANGEVVVGNHRTGMLRLTLMDYPERWKAYQEELVKHLSDYGFNEKDLEGIEQPVIVYMVKDEDVNAIVGAGNLSEQQKYKFFDDAKRMAPMFRQDSLANFVIGDKQSFSDAIRMPENRNLVLDFMEGLSEGEKTTFIEQHGYLTDPGVAAIKRSLSYLAIGGNEVGDRFLKTAFESAGDLSANVLNALLEATPAIVKLNANIESGALAKDYAVSDILAKGVTDYMTFMSLPPKDRVLDQTTIFDTPLKAGLDKDLIRFFQNYSASPKALKAIITEYVDGAIKSVAPTEQVSVFEMPATSQDLFMEVIKKANGQQLKAIKEISDVKSIRLISDMNASVVRDWEEELRAPIVRSLKAMLKDITPTPSDMPDWIRVPGLMSEDVKKSYSAARRVIKAVLKELNTGSMLEPDQRQLVLQQAFTRALATDDAFRKYTGLKGDSFTLNAQANKLLQDINQMTDESPEATRKSFEEDLDKWLKDNPEHPANEELVKAAAENTPVINEQEAFAELGADPGRDLGVDKTPLLLEQPVRGTSMGGTVPPVRPDGEMFSELSHEIDILLNELEDGIINDLGNTYDMPKEVWDVLDKQLPLDKEKLKEKVMASAQIAQTLRYEALVDYASRYGVDQVLEVIFPYQLWYTRSALQWLKKIVTTPAMMAFVSRYKEMLERNSLSGFPTRVGGKHMVPYGDDGFLFFDFLGMVYPPEQIFGFVENFADLNDTLYDDTVSILRSKIKTGELTSEQAEEAIKTRNNADWNTAMIEATAEWTETNGNAVTMTSLAMLPRASFSNALYMAIGEGERISPLQITKLGNMLKDVDPDGIIGVLGEIVALPENTARKAVGLNRDGQWGEYAVDRKLSEMVFSGTYTTDEVIRAMIDRSGPAYDEATRLVAADLIGTSQPGGIVYHAIESQNLDGIMPAIMTALFPKGLYSEAEMKQRGLQVEYNQAWSDFSHGDKEALDNFFEAHPEYEARLAIFKEPEERLKEYMIGSIWDAYGALPDADKPLATEQLGQSFETLFLDNKTRNYDEITTETLALWGKRLGAGVPESAVTTQQADPMEYYKKDVSTAAQEFIDYRSTNFPNWYTLQKAYYDSPEVDKKELINDIWDVYNKSKEIDKSNLNANTIKQQYNKTGLSQSDIERMLGKDFQTYFLDKKTRDYAEIDEETLASWGEKLGLEKPVQSKILEDFPELKAYFDWKEQYLEKNPLVSDWLDDKSDRYDGSELTEFGNTTKEWEAQFDPVVASALMLYAYGEPLPPAAKSELMKIWEALGKPNYSFNEWLKYGLGN